MDGRDPSIWSVFHSLPRHIKLELDWKGNSKNISQHLWDAGIASKQLNLLNNNSHGDRFLNHYTCIIVLSPVVYTNPSFHWKVFSSKGYFSVPSLPLTLPVVDHRALQSTLPYRLPTCHLTHLTALQGGMILQACSGFSPMPLARLGRCGCFSPWGASLSSVSLCHQ